MPSTKAVYFAFLVATNIESVNVFTDDYEYDPVRSAERVEAGIYRHEAHNWCFQHNWGSYDLKPQLPAVTAPTSSSRAAQRRGIRIWPFPSRLALRM